MSRFSRTVSSVSRVSCWGTTPSRARICGPCPRGVHAHDRERAVGDRRDAADHPHRRGLAGAVRPQEAERFAGGDVEVDGVDGREIAEPFGQAAGMDERGDRDIGHGRAWYRAPLPSARENVLHCGSRRLVQRALHERRGPGHGHAPGTGRGTVVDGARRRADRDRRPRPAGHLPADPAVGRRTHLPDLVDAVQSQARAHPREPEGVGVDHRPGRGGRAPRPGDDPGRRPGHRRGSARRLGAAAPDLGGQGAVDRPVPQGPGRAAALLRAGADRDHAAPRPVLVRRLRGIRAQP